mgnify:CR=1 FL=1
MKLKDMSIEELEAMSYDDIALMVLTESGRKMKINELFKEVCNLLNLTDEEFMEKLPAFFEVLSTDHRFIMIENGYWDLKTKHSTKVIIDNDDDDDDVVEDDVEEEEKEEDIFYDDTEADDSDTDDDLKDLVIIDEDEEANGLS